MLLRVVKYRLLNERYRASEQEPPEMRSIISFGKIDREIQFVIKNYTLIFVIFFLEPIPPLFQILRHHVYVILSLPKRPYLFFIFLLVL